MPGLDFETATREPAGAGGRRAPVAWRTYGPRVLVSVAVVLLLAGGAVYASRISERAPKVVYTASLEEVAAEAEDPLKVDINDADVEELDELPEVGPATAEAIVEYRRANGAFRSVDDLEDVPGIGPTTIQKIEPFATV
jgi:competence protein ComEA